MKKRNPQDDWVGARKRLTAQVALIKKRVLVLERIVTRLAKQAK